ncbi:MAG: tetratricopeptide repeat protein [Isosphaeraceae bacterium]
MFRHRIKDLMIVNAVLAVGLSIAIALGRYLFQVGLIMGICLVLIVVPVIWVETYLYRKKHGIWYRSMNPPKPRPRYQPMTDIPYYPPVSAEEGPSQGRQRTRLFEKDSPSEPVSRASLLFNVAGRFEASGSMDAAAKIYQQILDHYGTTPEAKDAAYRLHRLSHEQTSVDIE